jgi:SAM-dependent methyltransferase
MKTSFTAADRSGIEKVIREKYAKAARSLEGLFRYPTGRAGLEGLRYDPSVTNRLPEPVLASYCGVGNPFSLGFLHQGEKVLDIGCGGGVDTFIAAFLVGPAGQAVGIDATPEMIKRARQNLHEVPIANVSFLAASAEGLPFTTRSLDVLISNGVFNLIPDKVRALTEALRVLKPEGRLMLADQVLTGALPDDTAALVARWAR